MAYASGSIYVPHPCPGTSGITLDAAGEKAACALLMPKTGNIRKVHFATGGVTTGETMKVSFQLDDGTGLPDGSIIQSGTVVIADSDDFVTKACTLDSDYAVTRGQLRHVVIEFNGSAGNLTLVNGQTITEFNNIYALQYTTSWTKRANTPAMVLEYDDGTVAYQPGCMYGPSTVSFNNTSNPAERGNRLSYPFPIKVAGLRFCGSISGDADLILYDTDGTTVLKSVSLDKDSSTTTLTMFAAWFDADVELTANSVYYACIKPTSATNAVVLAQDFSAAAHLGILAEGTNCYSVHRTTAGSGAFTSLATRRLAIGVIPGAFDDGAGGGGGGIIAHRGMVGGFTG